MTAVLDSPPVRSAPVPTGHRRLAPILPWLVPAAVLVALLVATGTPAWDVLRYALYLAFAVLLPGTLVHRALRGSRGNLPEDLGLGGATGLLLLLAGWALAAATGLQALLPAWPAAFLLLFAAVPGLRRHWRIAEPRPLPPLWSWAIAAALTLIALSFWPSWHYNPLPPADADWYPDLNYHLALVHELTRSMPFQVPQLAGDALRYTYLSDADMATAAMVTKIDPAVVLFRLWPVPIVWLTVLVAAALARELSGKWWAGALGGAAGLAGVPLLLGGPQGAMGGSPISYFSPSLEYVLPLAGLLLAIAVDVLRGRRTGLAWVLVFPLALACVGAKASALPPVVAGLVAAAAAVVCWHRDRLWPALALLGLTAVALPAGLPLFAGGGASVLTLQPFALLYGLSAYRETLGVHDANDGSLALPPGVAHASAGGVLFLAGLVVWWVLQQAARLAGLAAPAVRRTRRDPAAWLLAGVTVAGTGGMWLLWHPSGSQNYFFIGMIPFATVLTVWLLADRAPGLRPVLYGLAAGGAWAVLSPRLGRPAVPSMPAWTWALFRPLLLAAVLAVAVLGVARLVRRRPIERRVLPVLLLAAVLGASMGGFAYRVYGDTRRAMNHRPPPPAQTVTRAEAAAAWWLDRHAGRNDVVATNVHCWPPVATAYCDARAFWVAGLGGRRTLIESWGYTDQVVAADGVGGHRYFEQPAPYPDRYALNQRVFAEGDPKDVAELRDRYHVRWLFADRRAGPVSPRLAAIAPERHSSGPVTVYELR